MLTGHLSYIDRLGMRMQLTGIFNSLENMDFFVKHCGRRNVRFIVRGYFSSRNLNLERQYLIWMTMERNCLIPYRGPCLPSVDLHS